MDTAALANRAIDQLHEALVAALAETPRNEWRSVAVNVPIPERAAPHVLGDLLSTSQTELETGQPVAWAPGAKAGDFRPDCPAWVIRLSWFAAGVEAFIKIEALVQGS